MTLTRRGLMAGAATTAALARPAIAANEPIRLGWLVALTGPGSSSGIGFNRGITFAVDEINKAGTQKIELVTRDTQGDPTKAVNAAVELTRSQHVNAIWGPINSGESLAVTPLLAREKITMVHPCFVDTLIDPKKYPDAFRIATSNEQLGQAANKYVIETRKLPKIALIGDTTGYGTSAVNAYAPMIKQMGGTIVYQGLIEAAQADLTADVIRMRDAGAQVIMPWSVNGGFQARLINARGQLGWNVPIVGHPVLGSGEVKALLAKPDYWDNVDMIGFRSASYDANGKLPPRTQAFIDRIKGKIELSDTTLWWVACGYDVAYLISKAVAAAGPTSADITKYLNGVTRYPGNYGDYTWTPEQHNGYPLDEVVLSKANSFREGTFALAPGYG